MMRRSIILTLVAGALASVAPAVSAAQTPSTPKLSITTEQVSVSGGRASVLTGRQWRVRVVLSPMVPGQTAVVRFYRNGHRVAAAQLPLAPSSSGKSAFFTFPFTSRTRGRIVVRATHFATPQLGTLKAKGVGVSVVSPSARPGSRGPVVRLLQSQLATLGYVVGRPGLYDARTARAVLAFRKISGMRADDDRQRRRLPAPGRRRRRVPRALPEPRPARRGRPVAAGHRAHPQRQGRAHLPDELRQAVDADDLGPFPRVPQGPGHERQGHVHARATSSAATRSTGTRRCPSFPASHGCLRVPNTEAVSIFNWLSRGDIVDVYA